MDKSRLLACLVFAFIAVSAHAQFEAGIDHVVVLTGESGELDVPLARGFAARGEWFFSPRVSAQLSATFINPEAILFPASGGDVDLGTLGLNTYAIGARWHFRPEQRFAFFAGAGTALVQIGNLDDQFDDEVEADFDNETALFVEGGVRYRFRPRIFVTLTAAYMPLTATPNVRKTNVALPDEIDLDPITIGVGAAWRF